MTVIDECPICGERELHVKYTLPGYDILVCAACGSGIKGPLSSSETGADLTYESDQWIEKRNLSKDINRSIAKTRIKMLRKHLPGGRILEIGCATGEFLLAAKECGFDVTGLDTSIASSHYMNAKPDGTEIKIISSYLENTSFEPNSFDAVVGFHVLEHVPDPSSFLEIVHEILKPGGVAFFMAPNFNSWYRMLLGANWFCFIPEHLWHFTSDGLQKLFCRKSFQALDAGAYDDWKHSLWPIIWMFYGGIYKKLLGKFIVKAKTAGPDNTGIPLSPPKTNPIKLWGKPALVKAFFGYRLLGSIILLPFLYLEKKYKAGRELYILATKLTSV